MIKWKALLPVVEQTDMSRYLLDDRITRVLNLFLCQYHLISAYFSPPQPLSPPFRISFNITTCVSPICSVGHGCNDLPFAVHIT
jgi:hypothetical protein